MLASIPEAAARNVLGSELGTSIAFGRTISIGMLLAVIAACGDPVQDKAIEALGPEASGVPKGPFHRPGQPCVLCHSDAGGAPPFSLAGTVYIDADTLTPIDGVQVNFVDSFGSTFSTTTNCAGNFFVSPREYALDGPVWVNMRRDEVLREMDTAIYRDGSCAGCHADPLGPALAGHVFLIEDPTIEKVSVGGCL
jgi:hypothetical protein